MRGIHMNNLKRFLVIGLAMGLVGGGTAAALNHKKEVKVANATVETYIPMESAFFTDWTDAAGSFAGTDAGFWGEGYSFEALDTFFRGESAEGWTGTLTSRTWKQSTQYIYFQLGGAKDYEVANNDPVHLVIHYGEYSENFFNNTFVENPMTLRYYKIPDDKFATLTAGGNDFDMYIEIVDNQTAGYGFANFGYLHVNQTLESTGDAMRYFLNHLSTDSREWKVNNRKNIFNSYFDNAYQREVFFAAVNNPSESFASNSDFVNHWYFDHNYFNNEYGPARHFDAAISTNEFRPEAATNMPFNNDGGFFRGWYEDAEGHKSGFVAADNLRYRFISRPFVLGGTGIISVKMAGKASLQVIDATVKNTDGQAADLAWIDNHAMQMDGNNTNMAESGFNTTAMVNHVINLEAYLGRKIQLAIADYDTSGWSACYFDEIVVNYATAPAFHVDVATQTNNSGTFYPIYQDIYVNSAKLTNENPLGVKYNEGNSVNTENENAILNHVDSSDSLGAFNVWSSYLNTVREGKKGVNYCGALASDGVKAVLNAYNGLSNGAKQLVCASDDFERVGSGDWYCINPTIYGNTHTYNLGRSLAYLGQENNINVAVFRGLNVFNLIQLDNDTTMPIVMIVAIVAFTSLLAVYFTLKKKKQNN